MVSEAGKVARLELGHQSQLFRLYTNQRRTLEYRKALKLVGSARFTGFFALGVRNGESALDQAELCRRVGSAVCWIIQGLSDL